MQRYRLWTIPATELAVKHVGRAVPNVPLLGAFAAITGIIALDSVTTAIRQKFSGAIAEKNVLAAAEAFAGTQRGKEVIDA